MHIVTHYASGFEAARDALRLYGAKVEQIRTVDQARACTLDGLLLLGGVDINPIWYGEEAVFARRTDTKRDLVEWTLVRRALAERVPVFGICRGMQLLNVALGGALWQDIELEGVSAYHPMPWEHAITKIDRALATHMPAPGRRGLRVNSRHHQAVKFVAPGLRTAAKSEDGVIEAVYRPGRRGQRKRDAIGGLLGVQWHPEDLIAEDGRWSHLFRWFVEGFPEPQLDAAAHDGE